MVAVYVFELMCALACLLAQAFSSAFVFLVTGRASLMTQCYYRQPMGANILEQYMGEGYF